MPDDSTSGDAWEAATDDVSAQGPSGAGGPGAATSGSANGASTGAGKGSGAGRTEGKDTEAKDTGGKDTEGKASGAKADGDQEAGTKAAGAEGGTTEYTDVRQVLDAVAAGRLSPEEAAPFLDRLQGGSESREQAGPGSAAGSEKPTGERPIDVPAKPRRLRIRAVGRRVKIVGEPFVSTVAVDGPHVIRQDGDTLQVSSEGEFGASLDGFTLTPPRSLRDVQQKFMDLGRELSIRVNPALAVEVEVTAGSVNAERAPLLEEVRVTAGSARVRDVEGPIDVLVQAGSAQVEGRIGKGRSRLRVESGSLQLRLLQGSNVRIRPDMQLGRVQWDPPRTGKDSDERVIGSGGARLDLEVVMGAATVKEAP